VREDTSKKKNFNSNTLEVGRSEKLTSAPSSIKEGGTIIWEKRRRIAKERAAIR